MKRLLIVLVFILVACGGMEEVPPSTPSTTTTAPGGEPANTADISEEFLSDGTRCAIYEPYYGAAMDCDYK
jgi:hypothetical protein